jgi:PAS domain S-box-containing protein
MHSKDHPLSSRPDSQAEYPPLLLQASFDEIYLTHVDSLMLAAVNPAACVHLGKQEAELIGSSFLSFVDAANHNALRSAAKELGENAPAGSFITLESRHIRRDGTAYPVELRMASCVVGNEPMIAIVANDISLRFESEKALSLSESRFHAIVSNTPGMVYQFRLFPDQKSEFTYVSEGCQALLGISSADLRADALRFLNLILADDRDNYLAAMRMSARDMKAWNWEGRIWIEEWNDVKWINLRSTPTALENGIVQWDGIMTNITQSKLEEAEIRKSRSQLAELSAHMQTVKEQERTRIAREIHDDLGGNLTAIKMALSLLARRLPEDALLSEKAAYLDSLVDRTIESVHRIAGDLRPSILDLGIVAAIDWQAKEFEKQLGIPCEFSCNKKEVELNQDQATALFRIFQEAATNVGKHANASRIRVSLIASNRNVKLEIMDDGRGIEASDRMKPKSFGLRGMKERVAALGGEMSVHRAVTGGTVVAARIPVSGA